MALFAAACTLVGLAALGWKSLKGAEPPTEVVKANRQARTSEIRGRLERVDSVNGGHHRPRAVLDLNRAQERDFARMPCLGPALAHAVVQYRAAHGPFNSVSELANVPGLGEKRPIEAARYLYVIPPVHFADQSADGVATPVARP